MDKESIRQRLLTARHHVGLSQTKLAHRLMSTQPLVGARERGEYAPTLATLGKYAEVLEISPVWLICGVGEIDDQYQQTTNVWQLTTDSDPSNIVSVDQPSFSARMVLARHNTGHPQHKLAKLSGLTRGAICNYETGSSTPAPDKIPALAWAMNCYAVWLATGVGVAW
jgi:transcriptional regulator with XRE-family HTH domain